MHILEKDPERIRGFDIFEEIGHVEMQGLGRISIRSVHARGVGGIEFLWMQILEKDPRGIKGFDMFKETGHVKMRGLGRLAIRSVYARGVGGIEI